MNSTQQQIHIINNILDGALYECFIVLMAYVAFSLVHHIKFTFKRTVRHVPLADVSIDKETAHRVISDLIAHTQEVLEHEQTPAIVKTDTTYTPISAEIYTIRELKAIARRQGLKGYSYMTKQQLADNLLLH